MTQDVEHDDDHDRGLAFDLSTLVHRRQALKFLAGMSVVTVAAACGANGSSDSSSSSSATTSSSAGGSSSTTSAGAVATTAIPEETGGPFPGDGTNGPNVLTESGIVRSDIRTSFGDASGTATGVPITIDLTVLDSATGGALNGAAVYVWHCDQDGRYSMYTQGAADENYLRGVQEADTSGRVKFTSIFPAAYSGRWPHIHFEVYPSLSEATSAGSPITTSQLALPQDTCETVYATDGYRASARNLSQTSLDTDMVFRDGYSQQLATVTGTRRRRLRRRAERAGLGLQAQQCADTCDRGGEILTQRPQLGLHRVEIGARDEVLLVEVPLPSRAHPRVRSREDRDREVAGARDGVVASSVRICELQSARGQTLPERRCRRAQRLRERGLRQRSDEGPVEGELGRIAVGRRARDVADLTEELEASLRGVGRPGLDGGEIAIDQVDGYAVDHEPRAAVGDPPPCVRCEDLAREAERADVGGVDRVPVVQAEVPVRMWARRPGRPGTAERHRLDPGDLGQPRCQLLHQRRYRRVPVCHV